MRTHRARIHRTHITHLNTLARYVMTLIFFGYYNYVQLTPHLDDAPARAPALAPSPRRSRDDGDSDSSSSSADGV